MQQGLGRSRRRALRGARLRPTSTSCRRRAWPATRTSTRRAGACAKACSSGSPSNSSPAPRPRRSRRPPSGRTGWRRPRLTAVLLPSAEVAGALAMLDQRTLVLLGGSRSRSCSCRTRTARAVRRCCACSTGATRSSDRRVPGPRCKASHRRAVRAGELASASGRRASQRRHGGAPGRADPARPTRSAPRRTCGERGAGAPGRAASRGAGATGGDPARPGCCTRAVARRGRRPTSRCTRETVRSTGWTQLRDLFGERLQDPDAVHEQLVDQRLSGGCEISLSELTWRPASGTRPIIVVSTGCIPNRA